MTASLPHGLVPIADVLDQLRHADVYGNVPAGTPWRAAFETAATVLENDMDGASSPGVPVQPAGPDTVERVARVGELLACYSASGSWSHEVIQRRAREVVAAVGPVGRMDDHDEAERLYEKANVGKRGAPPWCLLSNPEKEPWLAEARSEKPTHICLDCGQVGHAGGYHDHGNGNAGDTCSIAEVLRIVAEVGEVKDERDELRDRVGRSCEVTDEMVLAGGRALQGVHGWRVGYWPEQVARIVLEAALRTTAPEGSDDAND